MSIIERAMGKQLGVEVGKDESRAKDSARAANTEAIAEREELSDVREVSELRHEQQPSTEQSQPQTAAADYGSTDSRIAEQAEIPPDAILDFADLSANGFIDPTAGVTRLTEEYQQIKRRVIGNTVNGMLETNSPANLIMITSSLPNEGKTFTSINLALSIAMEVDRTVLVVDVDIVKSDLSRFFGLNNRTGLYDLLGHPELDIKDVICKTNVPGLSVIPSGTDAIGVTEKLASEAMKVLSIEMANRYPDRLIIFDAPPILATSSARAMAPYVGQTVLVVESCNTPAHVVQHALQVMEPLPVA